MRLFVASCLSPDVRRGLRRPAEALVETVDGLRSVPLQSEHFTHVFLGERAAEVESILAALAPLAGYPSFPISLGNARVFAPRGRPSVVCLGATQGESQLADLAEAARRCLLPLYPDLETYRVRRPHVTLARFGRRATRGDGRAVERLLAAQTSAWQAADRIETVELIRSELSAAGAAYETLGEVRLRAPGR